MSMARLVASMKVAGCSAEQIGVAALAYTEGHRSTGAARQARYRERKKADSVTVTRNVTRNGDTESDVTIAEPRARVLYVQNKELPLEVSTSNAADAAPAADPVTLAPDKPTTPDALLYRRARELVGERAVSLVTKLKRQNGGDIAATREILEQAALADQPTSYLAAIVRRGEGRATFGEARAPPGKPPSATSLRLQVLSELYNEPDSSNDHEAGPEIACADAGGGAGRLVSWAGRAR